MSENTKKTNMERLWSDKKRILGLPISFTTYYLENDRLYVKKGFFNTSTDEMLLYRILDVKSTQTFGQKIFGVGTVSIHCADKTNKVLMLYNIKNHEKVHRDISDIVEKERLERGLVGNEMLGAINICDC